MKYYGIVSSSGLGVYDDEMKLEGAKKYLHKHAVKDYKSEQKAKKDTIDRYNELLMKRDEISGYYNESDMKLNWIYYKKKLE